MSIRKFLTFGSVVFVVALLTSCSGGKPETSDSDQSASTLQINGAGSTFVAPLIKKWIEVYEQNHSDVSFTYDAVGSGEGIKRFIAGTVDFGASDAAMNDAEIDKVAPPAGRGVNLIPISAGQVVLAYNIEGVQEMISLPRDVYADIFLGSIKKWNDSRIQAANPKITLPNKSIILVTRNDSSGTTFAFTNHLSAISSTWKEQIGVGKKVDWPGSAMSVTGNDGVAQRLKITANSIGYVEYAYAKRLGLTVAKLGNKMGNLIAPGAESGSAALDISNIPENLRIFLPDPDGAQAYPIISLVWALLPGSFEDYQKTSAVKAAFSWGLNEGQSIAEEMGYIPLPASLISKSQEKLQSIQ